MDRRVCVLFLRSGDLPAVDGLDGVYGLSCGLLRIVRRGDCVFDLLFRFLLGGGIIALLQHLYCRYILTDRRYYVHKLLCGIIF